MGLSCTYKTNPPGISRNDDHHTPQSSNVIQESGTPASDFLSPEIPILLDPTNELVISNPGFQIEDVLHDISANTIPQSRVNFCIQQFKSYPEMLLRRNRTPFIHPELYNDFFPFPQALQEAYCACALYLSKTEATSVTVFRVIESKCSQNLEGHSGWTISEHLATLQAFCLFQIIRLFDGDIRQRAIAEQQESIVADWTIDLLRRTETAQPPVSPSWHDWIFGESMRRTIVMSLMLQGVYSVVKRGYCCIADAVTSMSFTVQAALWEAGSAYHWEKVFREKNHFEVNNMDFGELLGKGRRDDVEEIGLLMMATYLELDRVREWSAKSGFELEMSPSGNKEELK